MKEIKFKNVVPKVFSTVQDLQSDVWGKDILFERGGLYLVEAESGKGKSTFCSYITGYRHDYSGDILFDNENITTYKADKWAGLRRKNISLLFQELRLFPELSAIENVMIKNQLTGYTDRHTIISWFEQLGIADKIENKVGLMSFGQQQRVAMMRALAQPFDIILADEPISHLDDENAQIMTELMLQEARKQGAGVIVTSIGKHVNLKYDRVVRL